MHLVHYSNEFLKCKYIKYVFSTSRFEISLIKKFDETVWDYVQIIMVCVNAVKQITPHTQTMHQKNVRKTLNETSKWRDMMWGLNRW